jgi:prepilin-type N-terminal cleavage/methylation domain-containing protein
MNNMHLNRGQQGFTLVELAVVMIIIGLLIGGILKGQELIANAQVTSTVSQIKGIDAALSTFRDQYDAVPGDMSNPSTRLPNCTATPCSTAGNGDGRIAGPVTGTPTTEMSRVWIHLSAGDLITGIDPGMTNATTSWGGYYPAAEIAGGYHLGFSTAATLGSNNNPRAGHYLVLNVTPGAQPNGTALTATQGARIDRKLDDGAPNTGSVFSTTNCNNSGAYNEALASATCDLFIRVQG